MFCINIRISPIPNSTAESTKKKKLRIINLRYQIVPQHLVL